MTRNEAGWDRGLRVVVGAGLMALAIGGTWWPWGLLGAVPLLTGALGSCPLYNLLGVSTCRPRRA